MPANLFEKLPTVVSEEWTDELLRAKNVRIERIVSAGHSSPADFWYDQEEHEWVLLLSGAARLLFEDGETRELKPGDHVLILPHRRHRVAWTTPEEPTIWLAVFYREDLSPG